MWSVRWVEKINQEDWLRERSHHTTAITGATVTKLDLQQSFVLVATAIGFHTALMQTCDTWLSRGYTIKSQLARIMLSLVSFCSAHFFLSDGVIFSKTFLDHFNSKIRPHNTQRAALRGIKIIWISEDYRAILESSACLVKFHIS